MSAKKPTIRQKKVVEVMVANDGNGKAEPIAKTLRTVGYSEAIARNPNKVTGAAGFQLALEAAGITDDRLTKVMDEGLNANKLYGKNAIEYADHAVRHRFLETSLRIKGFVKEQEAGNTYNTFIQQNTINPNAPKAKDLADEVLATLLQRTKAD